VGLSRSKGRLFNKVFHPAPEASVIEAEWPIAVHVGPMTI